MPDAEINNLVNEKQNEIEDLIQQEWDEEGGKSEEEMDLAETPKPAPTARDIPAILSLLADCETK